MKAPTPQVHHPPMKPLTLLAYMNVGLCQKDQMLPGNKIQAVITCSCICLSLYFSMARLYVCVRGEASPACHSKLLGKHTEGKTKPQTVLNEERQ